MPAIVERETGSVLMIVDDLAEAEAITFELRRKGVEVDLVKLPREGWTEIRGPEEPTPETLSGARSRRPPCPPRRCKPRGQGVVVADLHDAKVARPG